MYNSLQAAHQDVEFDFVGYSKQRFDLYFEKKAQMEAKKQAEIETEEKKRRII